MKTLVPTEPDTITSEALDFYNQVIWIVDGEITWKLSKTATFDKTLNGPAFGFVPITDNLYSGVSWWAPRYVSETPEKAIWKATHDTQIKVSENKEFFADVAELLK